MWRSFVIICCYFTLIFCAFFKSDTSVFAEDIRLPAEFEQSAQLNQITPSGQFLRMGRNKIVADFTFHAISSESIEYIGILTVNGTPYGPLTLVSTPGDITVKTNMQWYISAAGTRVSVRFRLVGIGNTTKLGYEFVDITKDYLVQRSRPRPKRHCRCL
jgi:hypothetical protein